MPSQRRFTGYALAFAGAGFFSTKAIFIKLAFADKVDAGLMLAWRMIFSTPVFVVIGALALARRRVKGEPMPDARSIGLAMMTGFVGYYVASEFDFAGLMFISAQLERLVLFTYPLFVMFLGRVLYGDAIPPLGVAAAAVTYTGLAVVFLTDFPAGGRDTVIGTLLVLGAAISFALHQIWARQFMAPLGPALFTSIALTSAGVFCVLHQAIVAGGDFSAPQRFLWLSAGCALIATVLPTFLINAGLSRISSQAVSMISTVSPIVTIALAVAILGEPFTVADALGSALVLLGVGIYTLGDSRKA